MGDIVLSFYFCIYLRDLFLGFVVVSIVSHFENDVCALTFIKVTPLLTIVRFGSHPLRDPRLLASGSSRSIWIIEEIQQGVGRSKAGGFLR